MIGIGIGYGSCIVSIASVLKKNYGAKYYSVNYGVTFIAYTIVAFFAPRLAANIKTANNGDYTKAFFVAVVLAVIGLAVSFIYRWFVKKYEIKMKKEVHYV